MNRTAKAPAKTPKKKLTHKHRAAISEGKKSPLLVAAEKQPEVVRAQLVGEMSRPLMTAELAARVGISEGALLSSVYKQLGLTHSELVMLAAQTRIENIKGFNHSMTKLSHAGLLSPGIARPWWMIPILGEEKDGTQTASAANREQSGQDHEAQVAANLYWHHWAVHRAPGGRFGEGTHNTFYLSPAWAILSSLLGGDGAKDDAKILTLSPLCLAFIARVCQHAAEQAVLLDHSGNPTETEFTHHEHACAWISKLVELGCESAAQALVALMNTGAMVQVRHRAVKTQRHLVEQEEERRKAVAAGKPGCKLVLTPAVFNILFQAS